MRKIVGVIILKKDLNSIEPLYEHFCLDDFFFFTKKSIREIMLFGSVEIAKRINIGKLYIVDISDELDNNEMGAIECNILQDYKGFVYCAITNDYNNNRVINEMVLKLKIEYNLCLLNGFNNIIINKKLAEIINDYEYPENIDKITQIKAEMDETKDILLKSIDSLLERGEKIEHLVEKTEILSQSSKSFYRSAKRLNSCCNII